MHLMAEVVKAFSTFDWYGQSCQGSMNGNRVATLQMRPLSWDIKVSLEKNQIIDILLIICIFACSIVSSL